MALEEQDLEQLQRIYDDLTACVERVGNAIEKAKKAKLPAIISHHSTIDTVVLPKLIGWASRLEMESSNQAAAFRLGKLSAAHFEIEKYQKYGPGKEPTASLARTARASRKRKTPKSK